MNTRKRSVKAVATTGSSPASMGKAVAGAIAIVLLVLYTFTLLVIIYDVVCTATQVCTSAIPVTSGMVFVLTTVGGLVSALVITQLAVTRPGEHPVTRFIPNDASDSLKQTATSVGTVYLFVWMLGGLAAVVVGVMLFPDFNRTLNDFGTTWLGIAVVAGYSYFGIQPPPRPST